MNILEQYFKFQNEQDALDFIYEYLDSELKSGHYGLVNDLLKEMMDNPDYWKIGINKPIFSLAFAIYIHHEPNKFSNRKDYITKLYNDYVSKHGEVRAKSLLAGLMK